MELVNAPIQSVWADSVVVSAIEDAQWDIGPILRRIDCYCLSVESMGPMVTAVAAGPPRRASQSER